MKTIKYYVAFFTVLFIMTSCDEKEIVKPDLPVNYKWEKISLPTKENLQKIYFVNTSLGFVLGDKGTLFKTINGGKKWIQVKTGVTHNLFSITFNGKNKGVINGLKTSDNGATWSAQTSTKNYYLYHANENVLIGGKKNTFMGDVFLSKDQGETWKSVHSISPKTAFYTNGGFYKNTGYLTSWYSGRVLKTIDGGNNWVTILNGTDGPDGGSRKYDDFSGLYIKDANTIYISARDYIIKSVDGGRNFSILYNNNKEKFNEISVNDKTIVGVGQNGTVIISKDDGKKWETKELVPSNRLSDVVINKGVAYVVGYKGEFWKKKL